MSNYKSGPYEITIGGVACKGNVKKVGNEREYTTWRNLIYKCYKEGTVSYDYFGGKGVTINERWLCFEYFLQDIKKIDGYDESQYLDKQLELDITAKVWYKDKTEIEVGLDTCVFFNRKLGYKSKRKKFNHERDIGVKCIKVKNNEGVVIYLEDFKEIEMFLERTGVNSLDILLNMIDPENYKEVGGWTFELVKKDYYCVYTHTYAGEVFYVGSGTYKRPYDFRSEGMFKRSPEWWEYCNQDSASIEVNIVRKFTDKDESLEFERYYTKMLIEQGVGLINRRYGNEISTKTREYMSEIQLSRGVIKSEYTKNKQRVKVMGKGNGRAVGIEVVTPTGVVEYYDTIGEAERITGLRYIGANTSKTGTWETVSGYIINRLGG